MTAPAAAQEVTIVALGDSLTQGFGLPVAEGFVPQLQSWLDERGEDVALVNAGVSGDTSAGGRARIDWTLSNEVDGLMVALGGNDMLRGLDPTQAQVNLAAILQAAQSRDIPVLLVGIAAAGNYGPDYKAQFDAIYPDLAAQFGSALYPDFLNALAQMEDRSRVLRDYMQRDGIHPNAAGVGLIVDDMGPSVQALIARLR